MSGGSLLKKGDPYAQYLVDFGLPSGTLWMDRNLGANAQESYGLYFAWGETTGYVNTSARNAALGRTDGFTADSYAATGANLISTNLSGDTDAATVTLGRNYRMPTTADVVELINNTDREWISNYNNTGVRGQKVMKKTDHSIYIFFPLTPIHMGNNTVYATAAYYWTSGFKSSVAAYSYTFNGNSASIDNHDYRSMRSNGMGVRAVYSQQ